MNSLWNSFKIVFSMFSKIPMPQAEWTKKNMQYMFCFFPFIGLVIGGLTCAAACLGNMFSMNSVFVCAILVIIPVLVTGGIHVDGLLDTADAMSSWQERSRRLEILKDSNAGAFAVITACVFFLAEFGAYNQIWNDPKAILVVSAGFMVSRCLSGIGVVTIPKAREDGTVAEFSRSAQEVRIRTVLIIYLLLLLAFLLFCSPLTGGAAFASALLVFAYYRHMAMKYFGGTTGDLAGFFLCTCEAAVLVVTAVITGIM